MNRQLMQERGEKVQSSKPEGDNSMTEADIPLADKDPAEFGTTSEESSVEGSVGQGSDKDGTSTAPTPKRNPQGKLARGSISSASTSKDFLASLSLTKSGREIRIRPRQCSQSLKEKRNKSCWWSTSTQDVEKQAPEGLRRAV